MNMIYNASAGTGKTFQVTELYTALVLGLPHDRLPPARRPVDPARILLMTFTDNAAAELRQRVGARVISAEQEALAGGDEAADRARRVLRSLPAAQISTIHAFCAGLLREHALDCGLSPTFRTLEDEERSRLLDEVLRAAIFERLEKESGAYDAEFAEFCSGVSVLGRPDNRYSVLNTVRSLLEKAAGRGLDLSRAEAMLPEPSAEISKRPFERIRNELAAQDLPASAAAALDALNALLADFPNLALVEALPKFGRVKKVKHLSDELAELKESLLTACLYQQHAGPFRAFARCLADVSVRFSETKRARDGIDFGDQLLLARDLLRSGRFSSRFDWVIVDEVQDTSRVQCDVIEALWGPDTNLVICGDRKQSIYAWRSADPQVMSDLEAAMAARGRYEQVALKQSYRSKDRVLEAVNGLFLDIYDRYEAEALEPVESIGALTAGQGEGPCVEFLEPAGEEEGIEEEMAAVARRIGLLVSGSDEWRPRFGHDGRRFAANEPFAYGDILILLKRSTHQPLLEAALRDAGIPYSCGGKGKGFFEQQEVRDLLLFLQVITQPFNVLALIGFLRSPFAGLSDGAIVKLGWSQGGFSHETLQKNFFEGGSEACERVVRYRERSGEWPASRLVRALIRETAYDAVLAGEPGGEQKLANLKKGIDWLRSVERGGQVLLPDVVRLFEKYTREPPPGASEALLPDPAQDAVTIMTVHGAKGLTKRVCFVPDISFGNVNEPGFAMLSPEGTLELSLNGLDGRSIKSPGWKAAREMDRVVRDAEQTNLLYVALTRARDLTVLSGSGTKRPAGWLKQAEGFLQSADPGALRRLTFEEIPPVEKGDGFLFEAAGASEPPVCRPLAVPKGIERRPVTALVEKQPSAAPRPPAAASASSGDRRSFGTLGHAVLEELAKARWEGAVADWIELLRGEFGLGEKETGTLAGQLESARALLREETAGADALYAEWPFVLRRGELLLDGTIDLLADCAGCWKILDYKFTEEPAAAALATYAPQLEAYREAVGRLYPEAAVSAALVLIGSGGSRLVPLPE